MGLTLSEPMAWKLSRYLEELFRWNRVINLVGPDTLADAPAVHLLDSLAGGAFFTEKTKTVADLGTGGGLPGIPLALANPMIDFTLYDPIQKKVSFVRHVIRTLKIPNASASAIRIGPNASPHKRADAVVSRAVADLGLLTSLATHLLDEGGLLIAYKGPRASQETHEHETVIAKNGFQLVETRSFQLPKVKRARTILVFRRLSTRSL